MSIPRLKLVDQSEEGIQKLLSEAFLNVNPAIESKLWNPLTIFPESVEDNPQYWLAYIMSQPEYFSFLCREVLNLTIPPIQGVILKTVWNHKFPMMIASRGFSKSFLMAVYALIRMVLLPRRQIVVVGAAFRQSKVIFEYCEQIWNNAPILRDMARGARQGPSRETDRWDFRIGDSVAKFMPLGTGEKIRGQRANDIIVDEMKSVQREIYETVISAFGAVSSNPVDVIKRKAAERLAKVLKIELIQDEKMRKDNQSIISGTCDYSFNHFAEYWRNWRDFITSQDDPEKLQQIFRDKDIPKGFNAKDYCVIRIPYDLIPDGQLDEAQMARYKGSMLPETFMMEFEAVFPRDSNGFFKRSLVEKCVASSENSIDIPGYGTVIYHPVLRGNPNNRYIFAVDPASEQDKFSIIVIELHANHRRIVYCWTTDKKDFRDKLAAKLITESDFYGYCARKIRELMTLFPCEGIAIDSQGGGVAVMEALHDKDKLRANEKPLWPVHNPDKPQDTDGEFGEHIIHVINFADANWTAEANHTLKKDFMDRVCLFPHVDAVEYALAAGQDEIENRLYDTLDDCIVEINELKDELATIVMTRTPTGRDKWDTPEIKLPNQKKGKMRKDRYSALVMGNMVARTLQRLAPKQDFNICGGWVKDSIKSLDNGPAFVGPQWAVTALNALN